MEIDIDEEQLCDGSGDNSEEEYTEGKHDSSQRYFLINSSWVVKPQS